MGRHPPSHDAGIQRTENRRGLSDHYSRPPSMTARDAMSTPSAVLEQVLLGGMLGGSAADVLAMGVQAAHLADDAHRLVFGAVAAVHAAGQSVDAVSVFEHLRDHEQTDALGGPDCLDRLHALAFCVASPKEALSAAEAVLRDASRRELAALGRAAEAGGDLDELQRRARAALDGRADRPGGRRDTPNVIGATEFLAGFRPLETIVDGLPLARGGIYSVTGATGHGKTTLCAALQVALRTGRPFAGREVTQGSVLVLAGENPDDYAMHLLATLQQLGLAATDLSAPAGGFSIVPGTFDVLGNLDHIKRAVERNVGNLVAVFVDTSAAFYGGDDENDNVGMRRHASMLRELTLLPGRPTVFVLCHPTKTAMREGLLPRGGGAFLAEIDGNLTVWKDAAGIVSLHHAGKVRGEPFDLLRFELVPVELAGHTDCRGRQICSTAAQHLPDERAEQIEVKVMDDESRVLVAMQRKPGGSIAEIAIAAGMGTSNGEAHKSKVHRLLKALQAQGLVKKSNEGSWCLTTKGKAEANILT
jgi:hypothetical protein